MYACQISYQRTECEFSSFITCILYFCICVTYIIPWCVISLLLSVVSAGFHFYRLNFDMSDFLSLILGLRMVMLTCSDSVKVQPYQSAGSAAHVMYA